MSRCPVCHEPKRPKDLMCRRHWRLVPLPMRRAIQASLKRWLSASFTADEDRYRCAHRANCKKAIRAVREAVRNAA